MKDSVKLEQHKKKDSPKTNLPVENISSDYRVKQFTEDDISDIYELCKKNTTYYRYMKTEPTLENLKEVLTALPPDKTMEDKYFIGFYKKNQLIAILDLIAGYPNPDTACLGWFMIDRQMQGNGIGTELVKELFSFLKKECFQSIQLGCIKKNKEGTGFWLKHGFQLTGIETNTDQYTVIQMIKIL